MAIERGPSPTARLAGAIALLGFFACAYTPIASVLSARLPAAPPDRPADAIVVLGAGVAPDGLLNDSSLRRLVAGIVLYQRRLAPRLMLLGPAYSRGAVEAEVRAGLARDLGVPAAALVLEAGGRTTREEAALVAARVRALGGRRILLVTGVHHMPRARALFEREGLDVVPAPVVEVSTATDRPDERLELAQMLLEEALARLYYRVAGFL